MFAIRSGAGATAVRHEQGLDMLAESARDAPAAPPGITIAGVTKRYGRGPSAVQALAGVDLTVAPGEFVSLVGPSGCGKSTLLRIVAGLDEPSEGYVRVTAGADAAAGARAAAATTGTMQAAVRLAACGYMPQRDMLLPWRSVLDNATLPLEYRGMSRREARREASRLLAQFGVGGFDNAWPSALSGGMRQRVALARTALTGRRALLLDEPFGALDALTRLEMQGWLLGVWAKLGATVLLVTHDLDEALYLSDRVYVMGARPGRLTAALPVTLPRPRVEDVIATPTFARLKGQLLAAIRATGGQGERR